MRSHFLRALAVTLPLLAPLPSMAQDSVAGPYLAARLAGFASDYATAAEYYGRLIAVDTDNVILLENAALTYGILGDFDRAAQIATQALALDDNLQLANLIVLVHELNTGDYAPALVKLDTERGAGPLLDGLLKGWIALGEGNMTGATAAFDALAETNSFTSFAYIHNAYALALVGDFEGADAILSGEAHGPLRLSTRGIYAHAQVLMQLDRRDDALSLLTLANSQSNSPDLNALQARIEAAETPLTYDFMTSPKDGMAEAFFTLSALVAGDASPSYTLLNSRAALLLRPDHVDAIMLTADLLQDQEQYDLANAVLRMVPENSPGVIAAEVARANVLFEADRKDTSVEVLQALARSHPQEIAVHAALGDALRRLERHAEAAQAYTDALDLVAEPTQRDWFLFYARGITHERTDNWPASEADFRKALELNPDQPSVLNYLGYSLVEKREKLDEALDMIERAVEARPNDGYIVDSLAWVLYRLGRFDEAVEPMERAVELMPSDPILNDHLGDVYWMVNRKREAEFQWKRALSYDPEPEDETRIRRKLDVGLDVVLIEESEAEEGQ